VKREIKDCEKDTEFMAKNHSKQLFVENLNNLLLGLSQLFHTFAKN